MPHVVAGSPEPLATRWTVCVFKADVVARDSHLAEWMPPTLKLRLAGSTRKTHAPRTTAGAAAREGRIARKNLQRVS